MTDPVVASEIFMYSALIFFMIMPVLILGGMIFLWGLVEFLGCVISGKLSESEFGGLFAISMVILLWICTNFWLALIALLVFIWLVTRNEKASVCLYCNDIVLNLEEHVASQHPYFKGPVGGSLQDDAAHWNQRAI